MKRSFTPTDENKPVNGINRLRLIFIAGFYVKHLSKQSKGEIKAMKHTRLMKTQLALSSLLFLMLPATRLIYSQEVQTQSKVCFNPATPCSYATNQYPSYALSFQLPKKLKWQTNYYSVSFYAVILKSVRANPDEGPAGDKKCSGYVSESEGQRTQTMFPSRKVFASRFGCSVELVQYTNVNYDYNFLAVYAGETQAEAAQFLTEVKATGRFPGANIRKMQVVLGYGD